MIFDVISWYLYEYVAYAALTMHALWTSVKLFLSSYQKLLPDMDNNLEIVFLQYQKDSLQQNYIITNYIYYS